MNPQQLADLIDQYRAGLDASVQLLRQLQEVAGRQRVGTAERDFERLVVESDARARITQALVAIVPGLREVRAALRDIPASEFAHAPAYADVVARRQEAAALVAAILETDQASMRALADAELARRAAMISIECGEATLAAYRRVLSPSVTSASLFNQRG